MARRVDSLAALTFALRSISAALEDVPFERSSNELAALAGPLETTARNVRAVSDRRSRASLEPLGPRLDRAWTALSARSASAPLERARELDLAGLLLALDRIDRALGDLAAT
jgi:hypothetical protein